MRWVGWLIGLLFVGLLAGYIFWWEDKVKEEAANNGGAICAVYVELDAELWGEYSKGNYLGAILGQYAPGPSDPKGQQLMDELGEALKGIEGITDGKCLVSITRMPLFQPGRIKVNVDYFRPEPAATP